VERLKRFVIALDYTRCERTAGEAAEELAALGAAAGELEGRRRALLAEEADRAAEIKGLEAEKAIQAGGEVKELTEATDALSMRCARAARARRGAAAAARARLRLRAAPAPQPPQPAPSPLQRLPPLPSSSGRLTKASTELKNRADSLAGERKALAGVDASLAELGEAALAAAAAKARDARDAAKAALEAAEHAVEAAGRELAGAFRPRPRRQTCPRLPRTAFCRHAASRSRRRSPPPLPSTIAQAPRRATAATSPTSRFRSGWRTRATRRRRRPPRPRPPTSPPST